ncbi:MAG: hypothetical protein Q7R76_01505 [Candidatus Woesearchaeota archaeon]|nr:hypothetical protein [Candidatus Woesearchaeota archaeon]
MNLRSVVLTGVTEAEFLRLHQAHYERPWEDRGSNYLFAKVVQARAYLDYKALLTEFRSQPHAFRVAFFNPEKNENRGAWEHVSLDMLTDESIARISEVAQPNPFQKSSLELVYWNPQYKSYHSTRTLTIGIEKRDGYIVPCRVFVPKGYGSEVSWNGRPLFPGRNNRVLALTDPAHLDVRL